MNCNFSSFDMGGTYQPSSDKEYEVWVTWDRILLGTVSGAEFLLSKAIFGKCEVPTVFTK